MKTIRSIIFILISLTTFSFADGYKLPPDEILKVFDAPDDTLLTLVGGTDLGIEWSYSRYESLESLSQEKLSLAGSVILPATHSEKESFPKKFLRLIDLGTGFRKNISLREDNRIVNFEVSPDRKLLAYLAEKSDGVYLRVIALETGEMILKDKRKVNMALSGLLIKWSVDSRSLFIPRIFFENEKPPKKTVSDISPKIEESYGKTAQLRTYSNLLETQFDMKLFDYYFTGQFAKLDVFSGEEKAVGEPGIYRGFSQSPDGKYFIVRRVNKPYSFTLPYTRFGYSVLILDAEGKILRELVTKPVQDEIPIGGVEKGIRTPAWIPTENSTIWWTEAQDEGDPKRIVPFRDKFYKLSAPFNKKPELFLKTKNRGYVSGFSEEKGKLFYLDYDREKEWMSTYYGTHTGKGSDKLLFTRSEKEKYEHPGDFVTTKTPAGFEVIKVKDGSVFLYGQGYSPDGNYPFLQRFDLKTGGKALLFRCPEESYENFTGFAGANESRICFSRETLTEPRNYFTLDLMSGEKKRITNNFDQAPEVRNVRTELITYMRKDSVALSGKLYYPLGYDPAKRYPLVIWAYPREYTDLGTAAQISGSKYAYTRFWGASVRYLALHGYVVLDNASMPIVGSRETRNDTFVEQIRLNAEAAIDHLDGIGIADRQRVAVGGHSYGAFMTANLLAYTDLFKAGIAQSGAYNRTLTPFGFQSEERTYWQAKEFYHTASPFSQAEKIKTPLLLVHGADDDNPGTFPIQSERMYAAVKGNGGSARLVMLPFEGHGYGSRESNLHVLAEICDWLDKYLKY
jgi:dipeptidyl aminopeptidase/acylaminoacyl peptidase